MMMGIGGPPPPSGFSSGVSQAQQQTLSTEQQEELSEILSEYDASDLSDEDASSIVSQIEELGISAGSALETALADAGFDARTIGDQAGVGEAGGMGGPGGAGGPGQQSGESTVDETLLDVLSEALDAYDSTEDDASSFVEMLTAKLDEAGYDTTKPLFDLRV